MGIRSGVLILVEEMKVEGKRESSKAKENLGKCSETRFKVNDTG